MKIKYNFGLLKQVKIGFLSEDNRECFYGVLSKVKKDKGKYKFIYDDGKYIEINELIFTNSIIRKDKKEEIYWFIPQKTHTCSGLFLFTMFDTFGFPLELSKEQLEEENILADEEGFYLIKELQKKKSQGTFKK